MNWVLLFSTIFLLGFFFFLYVRAYVRKHTSAGAILSKLKEEVRLLEAGIDEKTEQDLQLLEERIKTLRDLIAEAERRIAVFNQELSRSRTEENAYAAFGRAAKPDAAPPRAVQKKAPKRGTASYDTRYPRSLLETLEVREPGVVIERPPEAEAAGAEGNGEKAPEPRFIRSGNPINPKPRPLRERVAELHQAGFSADLIAGRLGLSITETELYLALDGPRRGDEKRPS